MTKENKCVSCSECCFGKICKDYFFDSQLALFVESLETKKRVKKGDFIYRAGDNVTHLKALRSGTVKIYNKDGVIQQVMIPGQLLAGEDTYPGKHRHSALATTDVELCLLDSKRIYDLGQVTTNFMSSVLEIFSRSHIDKVHMISVLMNGDADSKVWAFINFLSDKYKEYGFRYDEISLPISLKDMSLLLGLSTSSLKRSLHKLSKSGLIEVYKKDIKINNSIKM